MIDALYQDGTDQVGLDMVRRARPEPKDYGARTDGTRKGSGYFGEMRMRDGSADVATEISIGVNLEGKEREIPALVPTLSGDELDHLLKGGAPTDAIVQKAVAHARQRLSNGQSPFANDGPAPKTPGFFAGFTAGTAHRSFGAGISSTIAGAADILGAFGDVAGAYPEAMGVMPSQLTVEQRKQADEARRKLLASGPSYSGSPAAEAFRLRADDLMPDPATAGRATQLVAGFGKFTGQVVSGAAAGPALPAVVAGAAGLDEAEKLRLQGVDLATRTKAGFVQGVAAGTSVVLPVAGATGAGTVGLVATAGTVNEAALASTQTILRHAGHEQLSNQYDPFDPWNVALSYAAPGIIGAGVHGLRARGAAPATPPTLADVVMSNESGGRRYAADGSILTSPKGAQGEMQVMPATSADPGFGVTPAKDGSPAELARVGRDYLAAMERRYDGDPAKAMAAYNAGPGALDAAMKAHGDAWLQHMPAETQTYVARGLAKLGDARAAEAVRAHPELVAAARVKQVTDAIDSARLTPDGDLAGMNAHVEAFRRAHDQLAAGERVDVSDLVSGPEAVARAAQEIEARFQRALEDDHPAAVEQYAELRDSQGGRVLNTDVARELSPDYLSDRTRSAAVHEPASAFIKRLYAERLAAMEPGGTVVFTSGGTGAGKTTAIDSIPMLKRTAADAGLIYDTNMNKFASAKAKIDQALAAGQNVSIFHVQRDPVEALRQGALPRAARQEAQFGTGRTVPLAEHARTHRGAAEVIQRLDEHYRDDERVFIQVVDNTRGRNAARPADLGFVRGFDYNGLEGKLRNELDAAHAAGEISDAVYRGFAGEDPQPPRALAPDVARADRQPQPRDAGSAPDASGDRGSPSGEVTALDSATAEVAQFNPDLLVQLDGMDAPMRVGDLLEAVRREAADDAKEGDLLQAAVSCLLRHAE